MIKEKDKTGADQISASSEDYLKAVLLLHKKKGTVRCVDLADFFGYAKPSISHAVALLEEGGYLRRETSGNLVLTEAGKKIAELTYEKHCFFRTQLMNAGVEEKLADREACQMEHTISEASFEKLKVSTERRDIYGKEQNKS